MRNNHYIIQTVGADLRVYPEIEQPWEKGRTQEIGRTHRFAPTYKSNPEIHHRRSIRLKEYDYSQAGLYFVTICVQDRLHLFGEITTVGADLCVCPGVFPKMILNDAGQMIKKWWNELNNKYGNIELREYIIMPNHFHGIIQIIDSIKNMDTNKTEKSGEHRKKGEHVGSPLQAMIQWFKTMITNEYIRHVKQDGWAPFPGKLWQRNYYEHIIRDEQSYLKIADYIINNPLNWLTDDYYIP